jgi:hypothetical protein
VSRPTSISTTPYSLWRRNNRSNTYVQNEIMVYCLEQLYGREMSYVSYVDRFSRQLVSVSHNENALASRTEPWSFQVAKGSTVHFSETTMTLSRLFGVTSGDSSRSKQGQRKNYSSVGVATNSRQREAALPEVRDDETIPVEAESCPPSATAGSLMFYRKPGTEKPRM